MTYVQCIVYDCTVYESRVYMVYECIEYVGSPIYTCLWGL